MGNTTSKYIGLVRLYSRLIIKRGFVGVICIILANILAVYTKDKNILTIIYLFCFLCFPAVYFIDYKNENNFFKITGVSMVQRVIVKLCFIICLVSIQFFLIFAK